MVDKINTSIKNFDDAFKKKFNECLCKGVANGVVTQNDYPKAKHTDELGASKTVKSFMKIIIKESKRVYEFKT